MKRTHMTRRCAVAALAILMLATIAASVSLGARKNSEAFMADGSDSMNAGSCVNVSVATSPNATQNEKDHMCSGTCNIHPGYYTASRGYRAGGLNDSALLCKCCDPGTSINLVSQSNGSNCLRGNTYDIDPENRRMYVTGGCDGVFKWGDGEMVACNSSESNGGRTNCPYFQSDLDITDAEVRRNRLMMAKTQQAKDAQDKENVRLTKLSMATRTAFSLLPASVFRMV
jgi:hypothetical protein